MSLADTLSGDFDYLIADLPCTVVIGSDTIIGTAGELSTGDKNEMVGLFQEPSIEVVIRAADLTAAIAVGQTLTVDADPYRIERVHKGQDGLSIRMELRRR